MRMKAIALGMALGAFMSANAAGFIDTFDSINPGWVTDRYEPNAFVSETFMGDNRLKIGIDQAQAFQNRPAAFQSAFYNTQGRQRGESLTSPWVVQGDVFISDDYLTGENLRRTDIWVRDNNPVEANAVYGIFGVIRNDNADPFNPSAANLATRWRVWDADTANGWVDLAGAVTGGWHTLAILATGTSYEYRLDGGLVYTDNTGSDAGFEGLQTVFLEAYSFGDPTHAGQNYSAYWDNVSAQPVPEPATMAALGLGALALLRRRRK
jgi:hypothetical protein